MELNLHFSLPIPALIVTPLQMFSLRHIGDVMDLDEPEEEKERKK